ncbi:hypothetical protein CKO_00451 [Citrobacter koseri ATCC BAA-895]|uniref:Uncharacterized protein n=1 Tax=Citrobacter koseri (strain ATCC BAA-895 / CDC 4225-83 / SGSC4696) TaxID=290338 RepID=A8ADP3_CITK8|nr:hypothetical protein CKO_00451 [Citrobacter koseri ATCC BAA-895]KXA00978.1 hypothetical protein HMPREF3220_01782 [Citrobacter koseri]KXA06484.1 hypothetical protein HMPREF3207_00242 [Citrobacter koseri]
MTHDKNLHIAPLLLTRITHILSKNPDGYDKNAVAGIVPYPFTE